MGLFKGSTEATAATAGEQAMEDVKGWSALPMKEQALARSIVAGFAAELALDRELRREPGMFERAATGRTGYERAMDGASDGGRLG